MAVRGGTAYSQWANGLGGTRLTHPAASSLVVGDLLYFGSDIHHTAVYPGGGYIVEAPQSRGPTGWSSKPTATW